MRLVLASNNAKKLKELSAVLAALPFELVSQSAFGVPEAEEPYSTFLENALAKARHVARATGLAAMADDSGLCVDVLGGQPGVQSAGYAAVDLPPQASREARRALQDDANNTLLLQKMAGLMPRRASFVCVLVALRSASDPQPLVASGCWDGEILHQRRGGGGFGYDPLMFIPELGVAVSELDAAVKNTHSHRARAAAQMVALLRQAWLLG